MFCLLEAGMSRRRHSMTKDGSREKMGNFLNVEVDGFLVHTTN